MFPTETAASDWRATFSWAVDHVPCARTAINVQLIAIATKNIMALGNSLRVPGDSHEAVHATAGTRRKGLEEKAGIFIN